MFITQRELNRRIEKAVKEAHDKWEGELWRDKQIDGIRQQIDTLFRERYELFDKLNERVYVLERKTGVINPPEPLRSFKRPLYEAQAPTLQTREAES